LLNIEAAGEATPPGGFSFKFPNRPPVPVTPPSRQLSPRTPPTVTPDLIRGPEAGIFNPVYVLNMSPTAKIALDAGSSPA